jgi:alpha-ribazole phosphatase
MTRLVLVRHGQTDWNVEGRYQGQADPPLNEVGRAQVRALAERLAGRAIEAIYGSDLQRARETAHIIAQTLRLPLRIDPRLREVKLGEWEGRLVQEIRAGYPEAWEARRRDPVHARPPGGETAAEVAARVRAAADDIARQHPVGPVLVVSHGLALATLVVSARGPGLDRVYDYVPDNGQLEEIAWPPKG